MLFGARGTGKSTFLNRNMPPSSYWIDLLNLDIEARYLSDPQTLDRELLALEGDESVEWIIIDEVQKIPALLNLVHKHIERKRFKFALTGSSARKLKRGQANLLAGRAFEYQMFPLTHRELGDDFKLDDVLTWGSLPEVFSMTPEEKSKYLRTYVNTYFKEEIQAEQLVRNLKPFRAFLDVAAQSSGKLINYTRIADDIASDPNSVKSYFDIMEDTYLGIRLLPYAKSIRKRQRQNPKFYLFDLGVQAALNHQIDQPASAGNYNFGNLFEQFVILEIHRLIHYGEKDWQISYLRTQEGVEIDLIIERPGQKLACIEIKSTERVKPKDTKSLLSLGRDLGDVDLFLFSRMKHSEMHEQVRCLHWREGILALGI